MPMSVADLEANLRDAFPDAEIVIDDLAGDGDHYRARIVSEVFRGMNRVRQHQTVYAALKGAEVDWIKDLAWTRYPQTTEGTESKPPLGGIEMGVAQSSSKQEQAWEAVKIAGTIAGDDTLFALSAGAVEFGTKRGRKTVNIVPAGAEA